MEEGKVRGICCGAIAYVESEVGGDREKEDGKKSSSTLLAD
jgi:hypothetical protein